MGLKESPCALCLWSIVKGVSFSKTNNDMQVWAGALPASRGKTAGGNQTPAVLTLNCAQGSALKPWLTLEKQWPLMDAQMSHWFIYVVWKLVAYSDSFHSREHTEWEGPNWKAISPNYFTFVNSSTILFLSSSFLFPSVTFVLVRHFNIVNVL